MLLDYDELDECPGCDCRNCCCDLFDDDFDGPMDSPEIGDRESDHVWADLARSEAE